MYEGYGYDISVHLTNGFFAICYIFRIQCILSTRKWDVEHVNLQSPQLSQGDDFVCSNILL